MTVRVVIIEDSPIAQRWLSEVLGAEPDIDVVATLTSGDEPHAEAMVQSADLVLLDLLLPARSGLSLISGLVAGKPVVVVSDAERESALVSEALARGVSAFVSKRDLASAAGKGQLFDAVRTLGGTRTSFARRVFVLVGSTGAMPVHDKILLELRGSNVGIVLLQHMPEEREGTLIPWVAGRGWQASFAAQGDPVLPGRVLIAGGGKHLFFINRSHLGVEHGDPIDGHRPSATRLIESGVHVGPQLVVAVLSGLGNDGAAGIRAVLDMGASCVAQRPEDAAAPSMPLAALAADPRVRAIPQAELGIQLRRMADRG